ncbi:MAG: GAF domain-containing sensor histidine kinase [Vicinamibacterales bacterium]
MPGRGRQACAGGVARGVRAGDRRLVAAQPRTRAGARSRACRRRGGWVVRFERACFSGDADVRPSFGTDAVRAFACVPILNHQHHVVGLIEVHDPRHGDGCTDDQRATLEALAWQASMAFERARTLDRMHEWSKSLEALLAFTSIISQHARPDVIARRLVENAATLLKADAGLAGLALPAGDGDGLVMASEAYWRNGQWSERPRQWARLEGLPGLVLETEFPYITNDYASDRFADPDLAADPDLPVARALCTPIKGPDDTLLGFYELHKTADHPGFSWQDVAFLESLASMAAITIQNARLVKIVEDKNEQISALSASHMERLEEERAHIARELHDEAGQALIGIKLSLQALARTMPGELVSVRDQLDRMRDEVNASTTMLKNLARRLRPPALDHFGLDVALRQLSEEFQRHTGISVLLDCPADLPRLASDLTIFRTAQEAMTNAAKHARPTTVVLRLRLDAGEVVFSAEDDGVGFDPSIPTAGLGLLGLRERVALLRGEIALASSPGRGTTLTARVPR